MEIELDLGKSGAKRTSYKEYNLRDLLLKVKAENPGCDDLNQLRDLLSLEVKKAGNDGYIETCIEYACSRTVLNTFKPALPRLDINQRKEIEERSSEEIKTKLKERIVEEAQIILLDLVLPNGKALRDCTGLDCRKAGGWFVKIADKVGVKKKVGNVLTEIQLKNLFGGRKI